MGTLNEDVYPQICRLSIERESLASYSCMLADNQTNQIPFISGYTPIEFSRPISCQISHKFFVMCNNQKLKTPLLSSSSYDAICVKNGHTLKEPSQTFQRSRDLDLQ